MFNPEGMNDVQRFVMSLKQFNMDDRKIVTGLDLGTHSVKCVMGVVGDSVELIGSAEVEHQGIQNQQIVDTRNVAEAIRRVCQEVEIVSENSITNLWVSLGSSFRMFSSEGMAIITGGGVTQKHILQSIATARAVPLPERQEVVHILPSYFRVDRKDHVFNPIGLSGLRLETSVLLVTCDVSSIQDLRRCLTSAGRTARGFVVQSLASGLAMASEEDKNQGVCVIDMGKNYSQISVFLKGRVVYMSQVPFGGDDITGELVNRLKVAPSIAENLKIQYGLPLAGDFAKKINLSEGLSITGQELYSALAQSLSNCFYPIKEELKGKRLLDQMYSGMILTGGGSLLKNIVGWAREYFEKPIHQGQSSSFGDRLKYSTALGLIQYAKEDRLDFRVKPKTLTMAHWFKDLIP